MNLENNPDILLYRRFVDDTFAINRTEDCTDQLQRELKALHDSLEFTREDEKKKKLRMPFMDVLVIKTRTSDAGECNYTSSAQRYTESQHSLATVNVNVSCWHYSCDIPCQLVALLIRVCLVSLYIRVSYSVSLHSNKLTLNMVSEVATGG